MNAPVLLRLPPGDARSHTVWFTFRANFSYVNNVYGMESTDNTIHIKKNQWCRVMIEKFEENIYYVTEINTNVLKSRISIVKMDANGFIHTTFGVDPTYFRFEEVQNSC